MSDWLVGCDGAHSKVRHVLDLPFQGETLRTDWVLADLRLEGLQTAPDEIATWLHRKGVLAIFPITKDRYRVIADVGPSADAAPPAPTLDQIQAVLDYRGPGGITASNPIWMSGFRINERQVARYRDRRVFLAGDAAHVHSPAGGQGMNTGMQDAVNLAWKLALVCHGRCSPDPLLDSYDHERRPVGAAVIALTARLTRLGSVKEPALQAARNVTAQIVTRLPIVERAIAGQLSGIDVQYRRSPLNGTHMTGIRCPWPGERLALFFCLRPAGYAAFPRFALFGDTSPAIPRLIVEFSDIIEPLIYPAGRSGVLRLVRPDGYIACNVRPANAERIGAYLENIRRGSGRK